MTTAASSRAFCRAADLVGEGDLGRVEGVAGVFQQFGGLPGYHGGGAAEQFSQWGGGWGSVAGTDGGEGRLVEVLHRGAFAEKFRVEEDLEMAGRDLFRGELFNETAGASGQHGAAEDEGVARSGLAAAAVTISRVTWRT
jgi:hypothetical protein